MDSEGVKRQMNLRNSGEWLDIQKNTFTNWVNEGLKSKGIVIEDLQTDLSDGVNLVALVETLTRHKIPGAVSRPANHHQKLQNITVALETISKDGVKLVNIDSSDIQECNLKLILALVWLLVLKYQIGLSASLHKTWTLLWLKAVIPDCNISNFTSDWNDGVALHALLDFCKPGLSSNWRELDRNDRLENCRSAMKLALQNFNIPLILRPEDMASPGLDERSAMTYLSYFTRHGGPGYDATLQRVSARTLPRTVTNFTTDWQDGQAMVNLVRSAGGQVNEEAIVNKTHQEVTQTALDSGRVLGVEPFLTAEQISQETLEDLGMMTYSSQYLAYENHDQYAKSEPSTVFSQDSDHEDGSYHHHNGDTTLHHNGDTTLHHNGDTLHHNGNFSNHVTFHNGHDSQDVSQPLKVKTSYSDEDVLSSLPSIISSIPKTSPPTFHLVRKSSMHAPHVEVPDTDHLKVDIYSVGVIMESKMTGAFDPDLFKVEAIAPTGRVIKITGDGHYAAQFTPEEIGRWKVSMFYDGKYMDGCPIDVCDPSQVKVRDLQGGHVGKNNTFHVDCTRAGPGDLGVDIKHNGRPITAHISPTMTPGYKKVTFMPYEQGAYSINVHFNRAEVREGDAEFFNPDERQRKAVFYTRVEPHNGYIEVKANCDWEIDYITGWPFICHVTDSSDIAVYGMEDGTVCAHPELIADCTKVGDGTIDAETTFNGQRFPCTIKKDKPCVYRVQFKPRGPGIYKIWINYDGRPVKGSPFIQEIAELEKPKATGDGLYRGVLGKPANFTVDPRGFPGDVSVAVQGPSRAVNAQLEAQPNNIIKATYHPTERGPHTIHVKIDEKDIEGSPYRPLVVDPVNVRISGGWKPLLDEKGVIPLKVRKEKHLPFDVSDAGPGELTAEVQGPNGKIPVTIDARNDGKHSVIFTPREEGKHNIQVNWGGYPLTNSPYLGYATREPELEEPYNVRLVQVPVQVSERYPSPNGSTPGSVLDGPYYNRRGSEAEPHRRGSEAEPHRRGSETEPRRRDSDAEPYKASNIIFKPVETSYQPTETAYLRPIESNNHPEHAKTRIQVLPVKSEYYMEPKYTEPRYLDPVVVDAKRAEPRYLDPVVVDAKRREPRPEVRQEEPIRMEVRHEVPRHIEPIRMEVRHEVPRHIEPTRIEVRHEPRHVEPRREDPKDDGPRDVIRSFQPINVNSRDVEPLRGELHIREPNRAEVPNGKPVLHRELSPMPSTSRGPQKVILSGKGLKEAEVNTPARFTVDGKQADPGRPTAYLKGLKDDIPVAVEPINPQVFRCTYVPKTPGAYLLYTNWNEKPLKGSPFKVNVREPAKPEKVVVAPDLNNTVLGKDYEMKIDPRTAGPGKLTVKCTDPDGHDVPCRLNENLDGTRSLKMTPKMTGRHKVEIFYNGKHISGSPYAVDIKASQLKSPVKVWGPGIENGIIPHFQSTFWVDATGAGSGNLSVRIMGPKGSFNVKLRKASQKDKVYQCFYDPVEPGIYTINVLWSLEHVDGSPYTVLLATSAKELQRMQDEVIENSVIGTDSNSVVMRGKTPNQSMRPRSVNDRVYY